MTNQAQHIIIPTNPADVKSIAAVITDISDSMTLIEAKKDYIKEAKKALKEKHDLDLATISHMIQLYHKQNAEEHFEIQEDRHDLYNSLFNRIDNTNLPSQVD